MTLALGIDTGGTFTDGVVLDVQSGEIKSVAKSETTRHDLSLGIGNCIKNLQGVDFSSIRMVSLSTTLATNAIVEGQGSEVGLILIGFHPHRPLPTPYVEEVKGGNTVKGNPREELDCEEVHQAILHLKDRVEAFAVSGYLSVRNPQQEQTVLGMIQEMTDAPVVCGYQLSSTLGIFERTATAVLNARLIPIITSLVAAVKKSMAAVGIAAPLMVVKGDGSLIGEEMAQRRPIETILSGPAASIMGATYLTGVKDALVVDMGGTTTDVALLLDHRPRLKKEGAMVGGWLTRVKAADIITTGMGGDSHIRLSKKGEITVGPQKVFPLSWIVHLHPHLLEELRHIESSHYAPINSQPTDILVFIRDVPGTGLSQMEKEILERIRVEPHSLYSLGRELDADPDLLPYERLVGIGAVHRASLTPTDILHYQGKMNAWNQEAAKQGVLSYYRIYGDLARQGLWSREHFINHRQLEDRDVSLPSFIGQILEVIYGEIGRVISQRLLEEDQISLDWKDPLSRVFFRHFFHKKEKKSLMQLHPKISIPIVAIGAPVQAYFPEIASRLQAPLEIPRYAAVANAVGTVIGKIVERLEILVKPGEKGGYLLHAPWGREGFMQLDTAVDYALKRGREEVTQRAEYSGASKVEVLVDHRDVYTPFVMGKEGKKDDLYLESRIEMVAMGRPKWEEENSLPVRP